MWGVVPPGVISANGGGLPPPSLHRRVTTNHRGNIDLKALQNLIREVNVGLLQLGQYLYNWTIKSIEKMLQRQAELLITLIGQDATKIDMPKQQY